MSSQKDDGVVTIKQETVEEIAKAAAQKAANVARLGEVKAALDLTAARHIAKGLGEHLINDSNMIGDVLNMQPPKKQEKSPATQPAGKEPPAR